MAIHMRHYVSRLNSHQLSKVMDVTSTFGYGRNVQKVRRFLENEKLKTLEKLKTILLFFVRDFPSLEAFVVHAIIIGSYSVSVVKSKLSGNI